jgi:hypothetical protein
MLDRLLFEADDFRKTKAGQKLDVEDPDLRVRQLPLGFNFGAWIDSGITTNSRNPINPPAATCR